MKIIEIENCDDCPYFSYGYEPFRDEEGDYTSRFCRKDDKPIMNSKGITDWCSLPDVKKPKDADDHIWKHGDVNC